MWQIVPDKLARRDRDLENRGAVALSSFSVQFVVFLMVVLLVVDFVLIAAVVAPVGCGSAMGSLS